MFSVKLITTLATKG